MEGALCHRRSRRHLGKQLGTTEDHLLHRLHAHRPSADEGRFTHSPHHATYTRLASTTPPATTFVYRAEHIAGVNNTIADELSRVHDVTQLSTQCRRSIDPSPVIPALPAIPSLIRAGADLSRPCHRRRHPPHLRYWYQELPGLRCRAQYLYRLPRLHRDSLLVGLMVGLALARVRHMQSVSQRS